MEPRGLCDLGQALALRAHLLVCRMQSPSHPSWVGERRSSNHLAGARHGRCGPQPVTAAHTGGCVCQGTGAASQCPTTAPGMCARTRDRLRLHKAQGPGTQLPTNWQRRGDEGRRGCTIWCPHHKSMPVRYKAAPGSPGGSPRVSPTQGPCCWNPGFLVSRFHFLAV